MEKQFDGMLDERQLDVLLRDAFLSQEVSAEQTQHLYDMSTAIVFSENTAAVFTPSKEKAILRRLGISSSRWWLNGLLLLVPLTALIVLGSWWMGRGAAKEKPAPAGTVAAAQQDVPVNTAEGSTEADALPAGPSPQFAAAAVPDSGQSKATRTDEPEEPAADYNPRTGYNPDHRPEQFDSPYDNIPILTPKQVELCEKNKMLMLKALTKKTDYPKVAGGPVSVNGKRLFAADFSMKQCEVSNWEYRTFLHDLLIHSRFDDYLKARVDEKGWAKAGFPKLDTLYETKGYNTYPVVNISREGADLFCAWLENSFYEACENKKIKWNEWEHLRISLPSDVEWVRAARAKDSAAVYPWGREATVQNAHGCYLCNFNLEKSAGRLNNIPANNKVECIGKLARGGARALTSAGFATDTMVIAPIGSYNPNDFGLYSMSGNAAEMVWAGNAAAGTRKAKSMGGSWNSSCDNVRIDAAETYEGITSPSPEIGFRVIVKTESKPLTQKVSYKCSTGPDAGKEKTVEVPLVGPATGEKYLRVKKDMMNALLYKDKESYVYIPMGSYKRSNGEIHSVQAFYMQRQEVTNLQYRTFLYDLVLQKRYEDYDKAKVVTEVWNTEWPYSWNEPMEAHYFTHAAYDNYPVVNIPREGAELYCKWLTMETYAMQKEKGKMNMINDLRLPVEEEWEYAAHGGDTSAYPWKGANVRNEQGCYLANLCDMLPDSTGKLQPNYIIDGSFHTASVSSYFPNGWGLYNMAGNVSEMVLSVDHKAITDRSKWKVKSKGGNWVSTAGNLKINSAEEYEGLTRPTPYIGFRPVTTYLVVKNPGE